MSTEFAEFEIAEFWSLLAESKLLELPVVEDLKGRAQSALAASAAESNRPPNSATLAEWLIQQKALSKYQANIFLGGLSGPIVYGNYFLLKRIPQALASGCLQGNFQARHRATGHSVVLQFLSDDNENHRERWQQVDRCAGLLADIRSPHLVSTHEVVQMPEYRFVVGQIPTGMPLGYRVPLKSRIEVADACSICQQLSRAVGAMHARGLTHGGISPETVWLAPGNTAQVFVPVESLLRKQSKDFHRDVRSIGSLLYSLIAGKPPEKVADAKLLAKYGATTEVQNVVGRMLSKDPKKRIRHAVDAYKRLKQLAGQHDSKQPKPIPEPATFAAYQHWLEKTNSFVIKTGEREVQPEDEIPEFEVSATTRADDATRFSELKTDGEIAVAGRRRRSGFGWLASAISLIGAGAIASFLWVNFGNEELKPIVSEQRVPDRAAEQPVSIAKSETIVPTNYLTQELVADDGETLWETPTTTGPVDFSHVPPAAKILFAIRPEELLRTAEGKLVIEALGPQFNERLQNWIEKFGLPLEQVEQLIISLHTNDQFEYEYFFVIVPGDEVSKDEIFQTWGNLKPVPDAPYLLGENAIAYRILMDPVDESKIDKILIGSQTRMVESVNLGGETGLAGPMEKLTGWTDRDRQFNVLFLRNALFNDEGQKLMSGVLADLNRTAAVAVTDSVRAGLFSMHATDDGSYLELRIDRTLDLKADQAVSWLQTILKTTRDQTGKFLQTFPAGGYWDSVRLRFDNMLTETVRNTRVAVEDREVVANCWLPPLAIHNIVAASELTLSMAGMANSEEQVQSVKQTPQTLMELLASPRDLTVSTSPDLILLLDGVQTEIRDEYPSLPFEFTIRLMGKDLGAEGITQNQRPSDFAIQQKPLGEILTEIMVRANPDKNIAGPSDPNCKLVWVVAKDPDNAQQNVVLITTRKAALEKSYQLPDAFVE